MAPFGYASLIASIGLGWWAFDAVPDAPSLAGMAVIGLAGLASLARGRRRQSEDECSDGPP